jgi:hypothetical protein
VLPSQRRVDARPGISPAAGCGESRWVGESTTWASRQEAAFVSGRHDGSAEGKARARMAPGPRRESGPSLEDTRCKTSTATGVIVTNRYESLGEALTACGLLAFLPSFGSPPRLGAVNPVIHAPHCPPKKNQLR